MKIIGVTGGIGAGKSSVSAIMEELGAIVIDADLISKQVVEPGKPAWLEIKEAFGEDFIRRDKTLDRKKIAKEVFASKEKKLLLEKIIHREVIAVIKEKLATMQEYGYNGIVVMDVPIPVKEGFLDTVDRVWVVVSDDEIRLNRVMARGGISRDDAENRIKSQLTQEEYKALAHVVIENNGSIEELREKVQALYTGLAP
ncbi:MAG: dephospho-CoA kinase [Clostridiaceae bacterium]|nr:dephospho-CoA kinase [Clostridiaceae bacterium]